MTTLQEQVRSVLADVGFRFNEHHGEDGKFASSPGAALGKIADAVDSIDLGDDEEDDYDPDAEDEFDNAGRFPAEYTAKYGNVVEEIELGVGDLFLAKTDKGAFHVAKGEADRTVLADLSDESAGRLADMAELFVAAKPPDSMWITVPGTDIAMHPADDGGIRLDWADGASTPFTPDDVDILVDALLSIGPGFEED